jgi:hypothetical protein
MSDGKFKLLLGRLVFLQELRQYSTYEGLLEGVPTREANANLLQHLISRHRDTPYPGLPYLIQPVETRIELPDALEYPFGTPASLPRVTCVARFTSLQPIRNNGDYSGLVIIWLQDEFAFPIAPDVMSHLLAIDWSAHAVDMAY